MRLDPATLEDLASFYARRLPDGAAGMARTCRLAEPTESGVAGWRALLTTAEQAGRTAALAAEIARRLPDDENAQVAAAGLIEKRSWVPAGAAVGAVACVAALGLIVLMSTGKAQADVVSPAKPIEQAHSSAPNLPSAPSIPSLSPAPSAKPLPVANVEPTAPKAAPKPEPAQAALRPSSRVPRSGCHGEPGATIGWWYAGQSAPGVAGETITLKRGANVRASAPSANTHWRLGEPVGCGLEAGDTIRLGTVQVIPGGVWVELKG